MTENDPHDLARFVTAQAGVFETALAELRAGRKTSHWMWFVFPQLGALGRSDRALFYGLSGLDEAAAYLAHPLLGPRLVEATRTMLAARPRSAYAILGSPDDLKFRSCATLFAAVPGADPVFAEALAAFYDGPDAATISLLEAAR